MELVALRCSNNQCNWAILPWSSVIRIRELEREVHERCISISSLQCGLDWILLWVFSVLVLHESRTHHQRHGDPECLTSWTASAAVEQPILHFIQAHSAKIYNSLAAYWW